MSDTKETLVDVVADLRERAEIHWRLKSMMWNASEIEAELTEYADRIEAAAARERDEDRQLAAIAESDEAFARCARCDRPERTPGNAAAMREALEWAAQFVELGVDDDLGADGQNLTTAAEMARAALSAPARNCDRFATELDARLAWKRETKCKGDYRYWLFAPAEGKEADHA